MGESELAGT